MLRSSSRFVGHLVQVGVPIAPTSRQPPVLAQQDARELAGVQQGLKKAAALAYTTVGVRFCSVFELEGKLREVSRRGGEERRSADSLSVWGLERGNSTRQTLSSSSSFFLRGIKFSMRRSKDLLVSRLLLSAFVRTSG